MVSSIASYLILILVFINAITFSQKADSLSLLLKTAKTDSTKTILLSQLTDELSKSNPPLAKANAREGLSLAQRIGFDKGVFENLLSLGAVMQGQAQFDSAIYFFRQAMVVAKKRIDRQGEAKVCSSLGHSFMRKSQMDSSRFYLEKGLDISKQINDQRTEAGIYNNYGNVFLEEGNYQQALDYFIRSAKLYENPLSDDYGQCLAYSNIGNVEYRLGNLERALSYARQSMAIARRKNYMSSIGYAHKLLGRIYKKQAKYDSAIFEYRQGQNLYAKLGDTRSSSELLQNIGNVFFDQAQYRDALNNYMQSLRLAKSISIQPIIANAYSAIGQAYLVLKKSDLALLYLDSSQVAAKAIGNMYIVMDGYEAKSVAYEEKGDFKQALAMHQKFAQLKDSITQSQNRQLAEETQAKYELEKKEAKIALLTKDQELKSLALGRQRAFQIVGVIALLSIAIISLLLLNRYRVINRAKRFAEIQEVRNTIARDLHDDIGSTLSTINIISKLAMHDNASGSNKHLTRIAEQSSQIMERMTDMVWSINPQNDSLEKVVVRMKVFATEILEPKNIAINFSGEESLNGFSLDAEKRKNLFLIYKEAINNAAKYSDATEVEITFQQTKEILKLTVADNGKGITNTNGQGNGLKNMEARAKAIKARFELTTAQGKGTKIEVVMGIT
jgi:two-component system, NarL family, sensor histidine kinase UhpB